MADAWEEKFRKREANCLPTLYGHEKIEKLFLALFWVMYNLKPVLAFPAPNPSNWWGRGDSEIYRQTRYKREWGRKERERVRQGETPGEWQAERESDRESCRGEDLGIGEKDSTEIERVRETGKQKETQGGSDGIGREERQRGQIDRCKRWHVIVYEVLLI